MKYVSFENQALKDYSEWAIKNKKIFNKINILIKTIQRTPYEGQGNPEPLKYEYSNYWSRRITKEDRLVYKIEDENIYIAQCKGHYS